MEFTPDSYVKMDSWQVKEMAEQTMKVIRELRDVEDESNIAYVTELLSTSGFWIFKRTRTVTREQVISYIRSRSWLDADYIHFPCRFHYSTFEMCRKLVWACQNTTDGYVWMSVEQLSALEPTKVVGE